MSLRTVATCVLLAALCGCAAPTPPAAPPAANTTASMQPFRGTATYVERVKMPPGATLRIDVLDASTGAPIATSLLRDVGGPPIPFSVARPANSPPAGGYALRAALLGPRDEPWFETPAPVAAPVGGDSVELRMRRVANDAGTPPTPAAVDGGIAHWECGELGVMSRYTANGDSVRLSFNGTALTLPIARSASGARYADAGGEFWTKGATGHFTLAGEPPRDCVQAAQPSPWNAAAARGVAFRAVGNEPGWFAEVSGDPAVLDATLDYGEHKLKAPLTAVHGGFDGTADGKPVRLRAERTTCHDGMSGQVFEATVSLDALGKTYRGCGAWLQD